MARELLSVEEILAILPETPGRIAALTDGLSDGQLRAAPGPDGWSVSELMAHLRACHDVLGGSILRILAEDRPAWRRLSPRTYLRKTDYTEWAFEPALMAFTQQRAELLAVIGPLAPDAWDRVARVTEKPGDVRDRSARYYGDWMAGHEREHWRQIEETAEVLRD